MARRAFYSFKYYADGWRAGQVRNMGVVDGNRPATDNEWESVKAGGDPAIKRWIAKEMEGKSCVVVLIGAKTHQEKWIEYEIVQGWNEGKGLLGVYVHRLKDKEGKQGTRGQNPFDFIKHGASGRALSSIVPMLESPFDDSRETYDFIKNNLAAAIETAIGVRSRN